MNRLAVICSLAFLLAAAVSLPVLAQETGDYAWRQQKFYVDLGYFLTSVNTNAQLNSTVYGYGTNLNFERDLGLDDKPSTFRFDASWRMTNRQQLVFSYYQINRSNSHTLDSAISWGDYTFLPGSYTRSKFDSTFYQLYYRYAFVQGARGEFGGSIGVSWLDQSASIEGNAMIGRHGSSTIRNSQGRETLSAPIPVIGIYGTYQLTPKWFMGGGLMYLKVNVSGVDGAYTDAFLRFDYFPWQSLGFGLGWAYDKYDVSSTKSGFNGRFTYDFNGPMAYLRFRF